MIGEGVEEVERRRVGAVDVLDHEHRTVAAIARRARRGWRGCPARRRHEQLGHHRAQRVQRRGAVASVAVQPHGVADRASATKCSTTCRLADPGRPADGHRHELRRPPEQPATPAPSNAASRATRPGRVRAARAQSTAGATATNTSSRPAVVIDRRRRRPPSPAPRTTSPTPARMAQSDRRPQRFAGDGADLAGVVGLDDDDAGVDADPHGHLLVGQLADRQRPPARPARPTARRSGTRSTPTARRRIAPSTSAAALDEPGPGGAPGRRRDGQLDLGVERRRQPVTVSATETTLTRRRWRSPPRRRAGRRRRQLVAQDPALQLAEGRTGLEAELVAEPAAQRAERAQGVGLAAGEVLRRHQLAGERLVQRVGLDRLLAARPARRAGGGAPPARTAPAGRPADGRRAGRRPAPGRGTRAGRRRRRRATVRGRSRRMAAAPSSSAVAAASWTPASNGVGVDGQQRPDRGGSRRPRCGWRRRRSPSARRSRVT